MVEVDSDPKLKRSTYRNALIGTLNILHQDFQGAAQEFQKSLVHHPRDPELLNDLAVAYLGIDQEPYYLLLGLSAARQASNLDPSLIEAKYNVALALQKLGMLSEAKYEWEKYLDRDSGSVWSKGAKRNLDYTNQKLSRFNFWLNRRGSDARVYTEANIKELVSASPWHAHELSERFLDLWSHELKNGKARQAGEQLERARQLGVALARYHGDTSIQEAVTCIDRTFKYGSNEKQLDLIKGHQIYIEALMLHKEHRASEAIDRFERAAAHFQAAASPMYYWSMFYISVGYYEHYNLSEASRRLSRLETVIKDKDYPDLLGRVYWMRGLISIVSGEPYVALRNYQRALAIFQSVRASEGVAAIHSLLAENHRFLGQKFQAWRHLHRSLVSTWEFGDRRRLHAVLDEAAESCEREGLFRVAIDFRTEVVRVAQASGEPVALSHALLQRSEALKNLGLHHESLQDLEAAVRHSKMITDEKVSRRIVADIALAEASNLPDKEATDKLSKAIDYYRQTGAELFLGRLYRSRAIRFVRERRYILAEDDLEQAISVYDRQRESIGAVEYQASFVAETRETFLDMITLQLHHFKRPRKALEYAERMRTHILLHKLVGRIGDEQPISLRGPHWWQAALSVRENPAADVCFVEYLILRDKLIIWVLKSNHLQFVEVPIAFEQLHKLVTNIHLSIGNEELFNKSLEQLYTILVQPIQRSLPRRGRIVYVPDGILYQVPFPALKNKRSGRFLIEDHGVLVSASIVLFHQRKPLWNLGLVSPSALIVGVMGPSNGSYTALPWAEKEATAIGRIYSRRRLLIGGKATKENFIQEIDNHSIVHFAGHAVPSPQTSLLSHLVFVPTAQRDEDSLLFGHDIQDLDLSRNQLVVLAACQTAKGGQGQGAMSLAESFIAAGAGGVVATLWDLDDKQQASTVMFRFHRYILKGEDPIAALQRAQVESIHEARRGRLLTWHWANYQFI